MIEVTIGEWHSKLSCAVIFIIYLALLGYVVWMQPFEYKFLNRASILGCLLVMIAYGSAYVAVVIDDPESSASADTYIWFSLTALFIYLSLEAVLFCASLVRAIIARGEGEAEDKEAKDKEAKDEGGVRRWANPVGASSEDDDY